ncbi:hypothetical protein ACFV3I_15600 [Microbacterium sp. NPDC059771]|uniref:hypothetical protein n=1 Tax=Microbacterium sp. NPDC059771 TaxID=3346941 RepID=UPI00365A1C08
MPIKNEVARTAPMATVATSGDHRKRSVAAVDAMLTADARGFTVGSVKKVETSIAIMTQMIAKMTMLSTRVSRSPRPSRKMSGTARLDWSKAMVRYLLIASYPSE